MRTRLITPQIVVTSVCVVLLITAAALVFHFQQPESSTRKCLLFAIKAITTSGVPDNSSPVIERFLIFYLPVSVFAWSVMIDALVNRPAKEKKNGSQS
jgi:hypothetical protein